MNYKDVKVGMEVIDTSTSGLTWGIGAITAIEKNENIKASIPINVIVYYNDLYIYGQKNKEDDITGLRYYSREDTIKDLQEVDNKIIKQEYKGDLNKLKGFLGQLDIEED